MAFVRSITLLSQSVIGIDVVHPTAEYDNATVEVEGIGGGDTIQLQGSNRGLSITPTTAQLLDVGAAITADGIYAVSPSLPHWLAAKKIGTNGVVTVRLSGRSIN